MADDIVYGLAHLEQKCVEPGHWRIEGWTVRKTARGWAVSGFDHPGVTVSTLRAAREWILQVVK